MDEQAATLATSNGPHKTAGKKGGALKRLMARATTDESGKGGTLRRRKMRFVMDKRLCDPGTFDDDFELVLESPSSSIELEALKLHQDNPGGVIFEMAKLCIVSCDGEPVREGDGSRLVLWEALGTAGRALLVKKWNELSGGGDEEAQKKAESSTQLII